MTIVEAVKTLQEGGNLPALAEAIGIVASDPESSPNDLLLGLPHKGFVAEQAALALYRRTGRPIPDDRNQLILDPDEWARLLASSGDQDEAKPSETWKDRKAIGRSPARRHREP